MIANIAIVVIPVIVGPTASGKSDLAIRLALRYKAEIVNLDSIQVYRGLDLATAKVPLRERHGVPHHLIDIAEPNDNFTAGDYARLASATLRDIECRGRMAIFAGGTGFYLRALVRPFFESPRTDLRLRARLVALRDHHGPEHLHRLLTRVDRESAAGIEPRDWSRTMRAIEVYFQTGRRVSELRASTDEPPSFASRFRVIILNPPRDELFSRINQRAEQMFDMGLIEEVEALIASGVPMNAKAFQAHGYRRVIEYLKGERTREEALNQMKLDTRHYAKRQLSWWRAWPDVKWIDRFGGAEEAFVEASIYLAGQG